MNTGNRRSLWIAMVIIAMVGVALLAFWLGSVNGGRGFFGVFGEMPMRGYLPRGQGIGMGIGMGNGLGGLVWLLLLVGLGLLFVVGLVKVLDDRTPPPPGSVPGPTAGASPEAPDGLERLRELAELHDRGKLTDEEFTAAKRRLLGM